MRLGGFHTHAFHHVTVLILLRGFVREGGNCLRTQQYQNLFRAKMSVRRFVKNSDDMLHGASWVMMVLTLMMLWVMLYVAGGQVGDDGDDFDNAMVDAMLQTTAVA